MRRVVVTGAGAVTPIGVGLEGFFRGLSQGLSGVSWISGFDASSFPTRLAAEVREPLPALAGNYGEWTEALRRDRKSRLGVLAAKEAIDSAVGAQQRLPYEPRRIGLCVAGGLEIFEVRDLLQHLTAQGFSGQSFLAEALRRSPHEIGAVPADTGARVIRAISGAKGPYSVNLSACAAGTQALGEAFWLVKDGVADAVIVGGYDSMVNPLGLGGFCLLEAMTRCNDLGKMASRPFDASRDGFVLGEGAAFFVLEELAQARARNAELWAEIEGYGSSMDAYRVTDPQPEGIGARAAMLQALGSAGRNPGEIDYINAHGTGTPKNDPIESHAIRQVLGAEVERVYVSSTKSQIGHLIGAAGAVEFAASLFALKHQCAPATISLERVDPSCQLRHVIGTPVMTSIRRVMSNSFGFGGQNASIVLAQPPLGSRN